MVSAAWCAQRGQVSIDSSWISDWPARFREGSFVITKQDSIRSNAGPVRGNSIQKQHRTGDNQRAAEEHEGRPAASRPMIAALRAALRDQRRLIFVRCPEHAGK